MADNNAWKRLDEQERYAGYLKVVRRTYRMPDGSATDWDILQGDRTVALVAITDDGEVLLVRQFRPGPDRMLDELPGGNVGGEEDIVAAAIRELQEETGYGAGRAVLVGSTWLAGYATHERFAVLATGCKRVGAPKLDAEEFVEPSSMPLEEFRRHVRSGALTDTDIAYMCLDHLSAESIALQQVAIEG